ncbi:MAG: RhoGEF domain-containing protein, partial [archaeon]|nr:RhoGEF domain-containing protein [archaeon]
MAKESKERFGRASSDGGETLTFEEAVECARQLLESCGLSLSAGAVRNLVTTAECEGDERLTAAEFATVLQDCAFAAENGLDEEPEAEQGSSAARKLVAAHREFFTQQAATVQSLLDSAESLKKGPSAAASQELLRGCQKLVQTVHASLLVTSSPLLFRLQQQFLDLSLVISDNARSLAATLRTLRSRSGPLLTRALDRLAMNLVRLLRAADLLQIADRDHLLQDKEALAQARSPAHQRLVARAKDAGILCSLIHDLLCSPAPSEGLLLAAGRVPSAFAKGSRVSYSELLAAFRATSALEPGLVDQPAADQLLQQVSRFEEALAGLPSPLPSASCTQVVKLQIFEARWQFLTALNQWLLIQMHAIDGPADNSSRSLDRFQTSLLSVGIQSSSTTPSSPTSASSPTHPSSSSQHSNDDGDSPSSPSSSSSSSSNSSSSVDLKSYDENQVRKAQAISRRWLQRKGSSLSSDLVLEYSRSQASSSGRRRVRALREIVDTERSYVQGLRLAFEEYMPALLSCTEPKIAANLVFGGLAEITSIHERFLGQLEERLADWPQQQLFADLFLGFVPTVSPFYVTYVNKYDEASMHAAEISRHPQVQHLLGLVRSGLRPDAFSASLTNLPLESLLIMPIQRLPRYVLLLRELRSLTPPEHVDHANIEDAQSLCSETTLVINQAKSQHDYRSRLVALEQTIQRLPVSLVSPGRIIVNQSALTARIGSHGKGVYHFVLFSDAFLCLSKQKSSELFQFHSLHSLNRCLLTELDVRISKLRSAVRSTIREAPFL